MNNTTSTNIATFNENNIIKKLPSPQEFLRQAVGRKVLVKLNNNIEYTGILMCLDGTMNIYLKQCEEISNGKIINKYADIFIRGNNGKYIFLFKLFF